MSISTVPYRGCLITSHQSLIFPNVPFYSTSHLGGDGEFEIVPMVINDMWINALLMYKSPIENHKSVEKIKISVHLLLEDLKIPNSQFCLYYFSTNLGVGP